MLASHSCVFVYAVSLLALLPCPCIFIHSLEATLRKKQEKQGLTMMLACYDYDKQNL